MADVVELDETFVWGRPKPGAIDVWVRIAIAIGCVVTIVAIGAVGHELWRVGEARFGAERVWFRHGPAVVAAALLGGALIPPGTTSRFVRLAVLLPVIHIAALVVAWLAWMSVRRYFQWSADLYPCDIATPLTAIAACASIVIGAGTLITWTKRRERIHAIVILALTLLLLCGLWLPIGAGWWASRPLRGSEWSSFESALDHSIRLRVWLFAPPLVMACAYTAIAVHRPHALRRHAITIAVVIALAFTFAIALRVSADANRHILYLHFAYIPAALTFVAIGSLVALGAGILSRVGRARRILARPDIRAGAVIADDEAEPIAAVAIEGWLRGPRTITHGFRVATPEGDLGIPAGVELVTAVPLATTMCRTGEGVVALRHGDAVVVGGFETHDASDPFRSAELALPGRDGVVVGTLGTPPPSPLNLALLGMWRPSFAYLMILAAIAVPALVGLGD